jgi:hypothetical protein
MSTCVICSCTDEEACEGGCSWLIEFDDGTGICDGSDECIEAFDTLGDIVDSPPPPREGLILPGDPEFDIRLAKEVSR